MVLEERTLHYYLRVFSFTLIIFIFLFALYFIYILNKNLVLKENNLKIKKGERIINVIKNNINNFSLFDIELIKFYLKIKNIFIKNKFHYGEFNLNEVYTIIDFFNIISNPSNILSKITIIEGWSQKQLNLELSKYFEDSYLIPYEDIIADTYFFNKNISFNSFLEKLYQSKLDYFKKNQNKKLDNLTNNEIMIIGSLLEKEGFDEEDKKIISSVIFNRLKKGMRLQIDATVLYSITNGNYDLERKLLLTDLKIKHPFNTYVNNGLPPKPISYVGRKTLDIVFENYNTEFLFYFFDKSLNRHVFSKNFYEHKEKLNEYRSKK